MDSTGWAECYWCGGTFFDMYIPDAVGAPLCGDCLDVLIEDGCPRKPTAMHHYWLYITMVLAPCAPKMPEEVWELIASFVVRDDIPGKGSRVQPLGSLRFMHH